MIPIHVVFENLYKSDKILENSETLGILHNMVIFPHQTFHLKLLYL